MNLYSHAVLAVHLQPLVQPDDPAGYLWGAVAPDIRYLAGLRRDATHLPEREIAAWFARYPGCASFIQGYRVHCLLDQIDTARVVGRAFPLNLLRVLRRKEFSYQQMAVTIELYYQKKFPRGLVLEGSHNPILAELGIDADQSAAYASALKDYLASPTFESAAAAFTRLGFLEDVRLEKYTRAYRTVQNNHLLLWALMTAARNSRLEEKATLVYNASRVGKPEKNK
jgi:hypothetical protein